MRGAAPRWVARIAAPVAFLLAATVAVLLVRSAISSDDEPPATATTVVSEPRRQATTAAPEPRYYTIERGDTLESIAAERDTTVERLLQLNPGIDPVSLEVGQRLRVP